MRYNNYVTKGESDVKKLFAVAGAAIMLASVCLTGACAGIRENASVHDPSVFYDEASGTYYAFGSHFAVASSKDLVNWRQVSSDNEAEKLYGTSDWKSVLTAGVAEVNPDASIVSTWAPDVEYYNGKYYMYYSLTYAFGSNYSAIGRVSADSVTGPYSGDTVVLSSVGADSSSPNCIDPELFYDKDGRLWMVYGSFFGGIYVTELYNEGENWGLPKQSGYGTRVWANPSAGVEGAFIFYNADTDYYYLITSHGSLSTNYNMRVARSKSPDGPYEGITGENVALNGEAAYKLAGNYIVGDAQGYAAIGHCSVAEKDGEFFVVAHSRREDEATGGVTGAHEMWTAKLLFNEDGWPVMSPCRYTGEEARSFGASEIAGSYDVVLHDSFTTDRFVQSEEYTFAADGKITLAATGAELGSWALSENGKYITVELNGTPYKGVVAECHQTYSGGGSVVCVSAVAADGRMLWAIGR